MDPFVSHDWWAEHADEVATVFVGTAGEPPPGALVLDVDADLSSASTPASGRHPLPAPEAFAAALTRVGLGPDDAVVAVDAAGGVMAARLVWMLRALGRDAALLDGGLHPDDVVPARGAGVDPAPVLPWPGALIADLADAVDPENLVLDARPRERYLGAPDPLDPRPGHLPGAVSLPCRDTLDPNGRLLPDEVLRGRLAALGDDGSRSVVSTCGSGVTACHTLLVREHLGLPAGRLYPGSWSQYAADPGRPVEL